MRWMGKDYESKQFLRETTWIDFSYGISLKQKYKNILFCLNMDWVRSKNYLWIDKHNVTNFYVFLNTVYLW